LDGARHRGIDEGPADRDHAAACIGAPISASADEVFA
jgi:hypothetical protein